jgi:uncharacterized lipoprotein YmbA
MRTIAMVGAALLAAGCGSAPKESFYVLGSAPQPTASTPSAAPAAAQALSVFVGPVTIPEDVDRAPLVMRTGPNQVEILDLHRWAEPLKSAIPRVLAEELMRELGTTRVFASRQGASQAVDYRVAVEVRRFESSLETGAVIDAVWTVTSAKGGSRSGRSVLAEPAGSRDFQGVAAAHSRLLGRLAGEIAAGVRAFSPT